jgi:ATP-binding cassette, subfamily B, bacterial MsbA
MISMKKQIREILRRIFFRSSRNMAKAHKDGLSLLLRIALARRWLVFGVISTSLIGSAFEGVSLLLLAAVAKGITGVMTTTSGAESLSQQIPIQLVQEWFNGLESKQIFLILILTAVLSQLIKSAVTYQNAVYGIILKRKASQTLQERITKQVTSLSFEKVTQFSVGLLSEKIRFGDELSNLILLSNRVILAVLMITVYVATMAYLSIPLTLLAVILGIVLIISLSFITRRLRQLGNRWTSTQLELVHKTIDYFSAPRLLRVFGSTKFAEQRVNKEREQNLEIGQKSAIINAAISPAVEAITMVGAGIFMIGGFWLSGEAYLEIIPAIMLFLLILNRLMPQVQIISKARVQVAWRLKMLEEVVEFLSIERKKQESMQSIRANLRGPSVSLIEFEGVSFHYNDSDRMILHNVNISIPAGTLLGIVGLSGSGKSTFVDILLGLLNPTNGKILVDGKSLDMIPHEHWVQRIGVVDQEALMLNTTIAENIRFGRKATQEMIRRAAKLAHADSFIAKLDDGLDTVVGDRGDFLSGGQRQRIAIARALLMNPEILVMDEATSALDLETERNVESTIMELKGKKTIFWISHSPSIKKQADQVIKLDSGCVIAER